ncbi:MAG: phosphoenolpyruvate--protein phosphotransferase [Acidobacteria bacterium]|nr:phosphoenolpyruvate--protein phosphotransferase [Acidobacteriota bacterium]
MRRGEGGSGVRVGRGTGVHHGIAIGKALAVRVREIAPFPVPLHRNEVEREVQRFRDSVQAARAQLTGIRERVRREIGETYAGVFDAQLLILDDAALIDGTIGRIRDQGVNAEWAFRTVTERLVEAIGRVGDSYLRERAGDLEDVHRRVQAALGGSPRHPNLSELQEDVIVVARELTPSEIALLHREHVIGFLTDGGGPTSHTAILAEALGIPAVVGLHDFTREVASGDGLILDAGDGTVIHHPDPDQVRTYRERQERFRVWEGQLRLSRDQPAVTLDGAEVQLLANIELPDEVETALDFGARGIGLYRSEFLFLQAAPRLPTEEDHYRVCRELRERMAPHPAMIRTLDLGGEKYYRSVLEGNEANPVMGLRAIRFCLRRRDIFRSQLRGILRASAAGGLRLVFPMISSLQELRQGKQFLGEVKEELRREGHAFDEDLPVGIMIEVPAAAATADLLAPEVDFFSIGTNDLIQYCLAIDRSNESVAYLYDPFHPAVVRMLNFVAESGARAGIGVSMCGEMAAEPLAVPLLLGMGLRELSMQPASIPRVRAMVRGLRLEECKEILARALLLGTGEEVQSFLRERVGERLPAAFPEPEP